MLRRTILRVTLCTYSLTVSTRMSDDDFSLSLATFKFLFLDAGNLVLWLPAFALAVLLRVITHRWDHQLIFPICKRVSYAAVSLLIGVVFRFLYHTRGVLYRRGCREDRPRAPERGWMAV